MRLAVLRTALVTAVSALIVGSAACGELGESSTPSQLRHVLPREASWNPDVVRAFDTRLEQRVIDRIELDSFLRERSIRLAVTGGTVVITGEVWTPLERQRAGEIVRSVVGVVDVVNHLAVRPPE